MIKSQLRSRSDQRSKSSRFALSATETGLTIATNPNSAKWLPKGWRRWQKSICLILSKGPYRAQVKYVKEMIIFLACRLTHTLYATLSTDTNSHVRFPPSRHSAELLMKFRSRSLTEFRSICYAWNGMILNWIFFINTFACNKMFRTLQTCNKQRHSPKCSAKN